MIQRLLRLLRRKPTPEEIAQEILMDVIRNIER